MCGLIGIIGEDSLIDTYHGLLCLQHRGQDSAGISWYSDRIEIEKIKGLVSNLKIDTKIKAKCALGHTRYTTKGENNLNNTQPMITGYPIGLSLAHNGNIINYHKWEQKLKEQDQHFLSTNDSELIQNTFLDSLKDGFTFHKLINACINIHSKLIGAYAIVGFTPQGLFAFRDTKGIKPLVLGKKENNYAICSETVSLDYLDYDYIKDIQPGEILFIDWEGKEHTYFLPKEPQKFCMFEFVYFSSAESKLENKSVYSVRKKLGERLASHLKNKEFDIVAPVPDTSRPSAIVVAEQLNLPYKEVFIKNRYTQRSFILPSQKQRQSTISLKLRPIREEIENKNILLVDDSLVRGTTAKNIVSLLRKNKAKKITLALTCPPIKHPCFYGIDFPSSEELLAHNLSTEEIAKRIGADEVVYLESKDLDLAINKDICKACVDNKYPTSTIDAITFSTERLKENGTC